MADKKAEDGVAVPGPAPAATGLPAGGTITAQDFMQVMAQFAEAIKSVGLDKGALSDILKQQGEATAELARKAKWPENATHPHISVFSYPEGDIARPKPKLTRLTYFCGAEEQEDALTPAEIDAYNAITAPREVRGGAWRAVIKRPSAVGGKEELWIWVPKDTVDQRMVLPNLHLILHELNGGQSTSDVYALVQQIAQLKAMVLAGVKPQSAADLELALLAGG